MNLSEGFALLAITTYSELKPESSCKACTDHGTTCDGFVWAMSGNLTEIEHPVGLPE